MENLHTQCRKGLAPSTLLVLQHPPVITKGRRLAGVKIPREDEIISNGIQIREADRGGLLTYHGPGQIVIYFILELTKYFDGISGMVSLIENTLLEFLLEHGVCGEIRQGHPGVWVGERKIASLGLRIQDGVTKHGLALNVCNDLNVYNLFDPCGLSGATMTKLELVSGREISHKDFLVIETQLTALFEKRLGEAFGRQKRSA